MIPKKRHNVGSTRNRSDSPIVCNECGKIMKVKGTTKRKGALEKCKKCLTGKN